MTDEGTPQGGPLSPLLSNIVLDELDSELERRGLHFVRYADDCNIFVRSERAGQRVMASIRRFIKKRLRLEVNQEKSAVAQPDQRHFLGFRMCRAEEGGVEVHLSRCTKERLDQKIRELTPATWGQSLTACFEGLNQYLRGWSAYYRICTEEGAQGFPRFDAHIRRRVRRIIIHQKKRSRHLFRHLLARGVNREAAAGTAYSRRGAWHRSNRPGMTRAYPNQWFVGKLVSLRSEWLRHNPPRLASGQALLFG
jgi:RNA-directed DNA polymerase